MLGLIVRNALEPLKLGQSSFDFGQKYEPLNSIVDGGIWRHRLESLDNAVAGKWLLQVNCKDNVAVVNLQVGDRNQGPQNSHLTLTDDPQPYGCG